MSDSAGGDAQSDFEAFEQRKDALWDDLLTAYAAGFNHGLTSVMETHDEKPLSEVKADEQIRESHYYVWDGRTPRTERWLREQFGVGEEGDQDE